MAVACSLGHRPEDHGQQVLRRVLRGLVGARRCSHGNARLCAGRAGHQRGDLVTCYQGVFPYPAMENAKPFAVEACCRFKSCHLFSMADGALLVGRMVQDCDTDMMTLHAECMARAPENVARTFTEEIDMVWSLFDAQPEVARATSWRRVSW